MTRAAVVGRPGAGKTLFVVRFAQWCGCRRLVLTVEGPQCGAHRQELGPSEAVARLVGGASPTTRRLQSLEVEYRRGKRPAKVALVDTVGLTDGIHPDPLLRRAMADTLEAVLHSTVVLHVLDGPAVAHRPERLAEESDVDAQIGRFGEARGRYAALVNKLDLPRGREGLAAVRRLWPRRPVIGISALQGTGFEGVRRFLQRTV